MPAFFRRIVDWSTRKDWTAAELIAMLGPTARSCCLAHAADSELRSQAASGGAVTSLLLHALETGAIAGAVVCATRITNGKVRAHMVLARNRQEVIAARGSKYVEIKFLREVLPLLRDIDGRVAVVGLPCDITALRRWTERDAELAAKVAWTVALFCGHNSRAELVDGVVEKLNREARRDDLAEFRFRTGHWRGELSAVYENGTEIRKPFKYFSDYRNLHFFCERKCIACKDHFGYDADISAGDVWLQSFRDRPIKETCLLVRSDRGADALATAAAAGKLVVEEAPLRLALDGQARVAPLHYDLDARARASRWLGIRQPGDRGQPAPFLKTVSAAVSLANMRFSERHRAHIVFRVPRPILRAYLYFKKGLESLR